MVSYMRDFLFEDRQAQSPVKSLSGGERNRLLLAKLLAKPSNLLILDEPTNDLDMDTLDLLEEMLADYDGTLLVVSHDRDFLDRLVTSVIAVEGGGRVTEYVGGYSDYLRQRPAPTAAAPAKPALPAKAERPKNAVKLSYKDQRELDELPARQASLVRQIAAMEQELADPDALLRAIRLAFKTLRAVCKPPAATWPPPRSAGWSWQWPKKRWRPAHDPARSVVCADRRPRLGR